MKILIIHDSLFGNTAKVAEAIKSGFAGEDVTLLHCKEVDASQLKNYELVFVGSPTHGGRASENTKALLDSIPKDGLLGIPAAAFDTGFSAEGQGRFVRWIVSILGYAAKRIGATLAQKGAKVIAAETFFVLGKEGPLKEGELERATAWAKQILAEVK